MSEEGLIVVKVHSTEALSLKPVEQRGSDRDGIADTVGKNIEEHLESKTEKDVKEAGAEDANQEEEEEKLVQEMKNELAADKPGLETAPIEEKEWK